MEQLFHYDNMVMRGVGKIVDCFYISLLWIVFCIPIITAGASTTAMYYTVHKVLRGKRGYIWSSFLESFKTNLKQSLILWLICLTAGILLGADIYVTYHLLVNGVKMGLFYYAFLIMAACFTVWMIYIFSYTARFRNTTKEIIKNCTIIAIAHLPKTILLGIIAAAAVFLTYCLPFLILLVPAVWTWLLSLLLEGIYRKYMSKEDLEKETELEMETKRSARL